MMAHNRPRTASPPEDAVAGGSRAPGLPWFGSWRGVYLFVIGSFVLYVILLTVFSRAFS